MKKTANEHYLPMKDGDHDEGLPHHDSVQNQGTAEVQQEDTSLLSRLENTEKNPLEITATHDDGGKEQLLPDGGWGWVVVFGASLTLVLVDTIGQCFGVVFSTFLLDLNTSSVTTAWIFNFFGFTWCLTGPPIGSLLAEFGWRKVQMAAALVLSSATIASAFVTDAWMLIITYSLFAGKKNRACVDHCSHHTECEGIRDGVKREILKVTRRGRCSSLKKREEPCMACGILSNVSYLIVPHYFHRHRGLANGLMMAWDCGGQFLGPPLISLLQTHYGYPGATLILGGIVLNCCVSAAVFHPVEWHYKYKRPKITSDSQNGHIAPTEGTQLRQLFIRIIRSTLSDLKVLRSRRAIIIAFGATFIFSGYLQFLAFVPFAMQESGLNLDDAAWCISVSGITNMATRVLVASLSDVSWFSFHKCYLFGSFTITATIVAFTLVDTVVWKAVVMAAWGIGVGTFMGTFNLIMVHYMGFENFTPMLGAAMLCIATSYISIGPLIGYIRDATDSYTITMWVLAATVFCSFILWLFMPAAVIYDNQQKGKKDENITLSTTA
ncbi:hypothetical protein Pcinc_035094 [Petrolisthes cinctipes]|uniref:Uncharacterized protein n=1 Tax=Petrolisthes cinctipes TaxID=88211 RepID=A0AAE1BYL6_PETCI|nr:hypothetical protein Pcinc_035094 [Petrolisthes cinctipes]